MGNYKLNQQIITGFGLFLFALIFATIFIGYQISTEQIPIIEASKVVETNLTKAQIELDKFNKSEHDLESVFPKPSLAKAIEAVENDILTNNIYHNLFYFTAPKIKVKFNNILESMLNYESLTPPQYHALLTDKEELIFITLYNQNEDAQNDLISTVSNQITIVHWIQVVLINIVLLYFLVAYLYIRKNRKIRIQLEEEKANSISQLKENNYFLEAAQDIFSIGYYAYNFKTKQYRASNSILKMLGLPDKELELQSWIDCIHQKDQTILTSVLEKRLLNPNIPLNVTYRIIRPLDGETRWIHQIADTPIKDTEGKLDYALGVIQDITEQKEADIKMLNLNQIIASSLNEIYIIDYDNATLIEVNDAVIFNLCYEKEALLKLTLQDIAPEITPEYLNEIRLKLSTTKTVVFETYNKRQNGLTYPVEIHIQKGRSGDKNVLLIVAIDTSERNEAKKNLLESENRWKLAIESTNDGLWDINFKTNTYYYSKRWKEMLGYQEHEIKNIASSWEELVHPDDLELVRFTTHLHYDNKTPFYRAEYRMLCKDGTYKWILDRGSVIERDEAKKPVRVIGVHTDITDRKELEIKNLEQNEQIIERDNKFKNIFDQNPVSMFENDILEVEQLLKTLRLNTADLKIYLDNNSAFVFECLSKIKILNINDFTLKLLNVTNKNEVINNIIQFYNQNSFKVFKEILLAINCGASTFSSEMEMLTADGKLITTLLNITKIEGTSQAIVSLQEITERKLAENIIKEKEAELLNAQKIAKLGSYNLDLITMSGNCSKIFGDISELDISKPLDFYKDWRSVLHLDDLEGNNIELNKAIKTGKQFNRDYRIITKKTKTLKWIHSIGQVIFKNGIATSLVGTIQDITERKLAEEALENSSYILQKSQEIANIGSYSFDFTALTWESSAVLNNIFGLSKGGSKTVTEWLQVVHPDDRAQMKSYLSKTIMANHENFDKDYRIIRQNDQKERWVHGVGELEFKADGTLLKMIGTIQDITDSKLAEEKLKQSDEILNHISTLVFVNDFDDNVIYTSPSIETILGYEPKDVLGQKWWQLTIGDEAEIKKVQKAIHQKLLKESFISSKTTRRAVKTKDGGYKWIEWQLSKGVGNTYVNIGLDVTEKVEKDIQFKKITETAYSAIILANEEGFIIECNSATEKIFGYTKKELIGKPIQLIIPKKYQEAHTEAYKKSIERGYLKLGEAIKIEAINKAGKIFPIEMSLNNWQAEGHFVFCSFIRDVSEPFREAKIKEVIFNITKKATESRSLKVLFNFIKLELGTLINTNNFFIALYDKKTEMISTPFMVDEQDDNDDFPKGKSLTGYIIDSKKSLLATNTELKKLKRNKEIKVLGPLSQCWMGVPLIVENESIGAIVIQSYTDVNAYTQNDVALVELIATNISQVIKQSNDFEKINLLNQALIQSVEAVIITDINGNIQYVNPAFTIISGYTEQEVLGKNPRVLKSGEQPTEYYETLWNTILKGETWNGEFKNKHKDGSYYLIEANISPVKNNDGVITHFIGIQEDITEKRKLERDFIHAFIDAQEQEKQSFGEDLHDGISQILSAESMYVEVLQKLYKSDDARVLDALDKIKTLNLRAITDARNIAHGLMSKQLKEVGLLKAVEQLCQDFNQSKKIVFKFKNSGLVEDEISKEIKINIFRITQEISTNIIRHSGAKMSEISLIKTNQNQLQLIVKDDGVGIDLEKMARENKGAGLKNIERRVTLLNGKIKLKTALNQGACYTIVVPL